MAITDPASIKPFLENKDDLLRMIGIIRLGQIGTDKDIQSLYDVYQHEPIRPGFSFDLWPGVKYYAIRSMGQIGGPKAESTLISIANSMTGTPQTDSLQILKSLCEALSDLGSAECKQILNNYYENKMFDDFARIYAYMGILSIDLKSDSISNISDSLDFLFSKLPESDSIEPLYIENFILAEAVEYTILDSRFCNPNSIDYLRSKFDSMSDRPILRDRLQFVSESMENTYNASQK